MIASFFMHLRFDSAAARRIFYFGLGTAVIVYLIALTVMGIWSDSGNHRFNDPPASPLAPPSWRPADDRPRIAAADRGRRRRLIVLAVAAFPPFQPHLEVWVLVLAIAFLGFYTARVIQPKAVAAGEAADHRRQKLCFWVGAVR